MVLHFKVILNMPRRQVIRPFRLTVSRGAAAAVTVVTSRPFVNKCVLITPRFGPFGPCRRVVMTRTKDNNNFCGRRSVVDVF